MGCSISQESAKPVEDEAKEAAAKEDNSKASEDSSAKVGAQEEKKSEEKSKESKESKEEQKKEDKDATDKEREDAATRIQAVFRGHHARKSMKETESSTKQTGTKSNPEATKEQLLQEFSGKELSEAATKIQATFRGHMSRKEQAATAVKLAENAGENLVSKMEDKAKDELEGIDLTDPDLHKAATKIQASFRGHKVRQEVLSTPGQNEEPKK